MSYTAEMSASKSLPKATLADVQNYYKCENFADENFAHKLFG